MFNVGELRDHIFMTPARKGSWWVLKFVRCLRIHLFLNNTSIFQFCEWMGEGSLNWSFFVDVQFYDPWHQFFALPRLTKNCFNVQIFVFKIFFPNNSSVTASIERVCSTQDWNITSTFKLIILTNFLAATYALLNPWNARMNRLISKKWPVFRVIGLKHFFPFLI